MAHTNDHVTKPGRKPGTEVCTSCSWRFPCPDNQHCGHAECWEFKSKNPTCYFCGGRLQGERNTEAAAWGFLEIRGHARAAHYCCRDQYAKLPQSHRFALARGYTFQPCSHDFKDKIRD